MNKLNLLRFLHRVVRSNFGSPPFPFKLNLMVTTRCNQKCGHCGIWRQDGQDLPLDVIRSVLRTSQQLSWLDVTGGEIFLRPDIEDLFAIILDECRDLALLHFPTNGTMPDEAVRAARAVMNVNGPRLFATVSLDGPPDVHNKVRGSEDAFEAAMETYLRLKEIKGCQVYLGMTLGKGNLGRYTDTLAAIQSQAPWASPQDLHVNLPNPSSHYYGDIPEETPDRSVLMTEVREAMAARSGNGHRPLDLVEKRYLKLAQDYLSHGRSPIPCRALSSSCFVSIDGTVFPCIMWDRPLGSLMETNGDLQPIWEGPAADAARTAIARGGCPGCWTPCEAVPAILADYLPSTARSRRPARKDAAQI